jgi:hypothetical protein
MNEHANTIIDGYGYTACIQAVKIIALAEKSGIKPEDLLREAEIARTDRAMEVQNNHMEGRRESRKGRTAEKNMTARDRQKARAEFPFMKPGEGIFMKKLKCECGGFFYIEALCGKTAAKEKCIRIATCVECNAEVKIR